ncbi:MAG: hypothetical protein OXC62_15280 [Aestuariivita sp.]|nr:hypothetical protein [Aestuariivita sp.]
MTTATHVRNSQHHDTLEHQKKGLETEIKRVRRKEEKRLIAAAEKAGFFEVRIPSTRLIAMIEAEKAAVSFKLSTIVKLKQNLNSLSHAKRKIDTRRKIILGSFVVAQCRHKPDIHDEIARDIKEYLSHHPNQKRAGDHLAVLSAFLDDPHDQDAQAPKTPDQLNNERTHRHVLLGTWLLERRTLNPTVSWLIQTELKGFLAQDQKADGYQEWLADVLEFEPL